MTSLDLGLPKGAPSNNFFHFHSPLVSIKIRCILRDATSIFLKVILQPNHTFLFLQGITKPTLKKNYKSPQHSLVISNLRQIYHQLDPTNFPYSHQTLSGNVDFKYTLDSDRITKIFNLENFKHPLALRLNLLKPLKSWKCKAFAIKY